MIEDITAVILAGGKSSRMGFDKRFLKFDEHYLLKKNIDKLSKIFTNVIIISNDLKLEKLNFNEKIKIYKDEIQDCGPLGGIHSALLNAKTDLIYVLACDMPNINFEYIKYISKKIKDKKGIVTKQGPFIEPFNGIYSKSLIKNIVNYLNVGKRSISSFINTEDFYLIEEDIAKKFSPNWDMFENFNIVSDILKNKMNRSDKMKDKIVVALGGNALGKTPTEQHDLVKETVKPIVDLIVDGHEVILAHGNGPQVGMINLAMETASKSERGIPEMPFPECGAMSQGYIGYHLQNAIREELLNRNMHIPVATIVSQIIVDKDDPAFSHPTKPIGAFYTEEESKVLEKEKGYDMVEDSGRGYRRVVPSPIPVDVVEKETIKILVEAGQIIIAVGGGAIPVIENGNALDGVPAVIDKDFASEKLAEILDADYLIILTEVEKVALNFGKENEKWLDSLNIKEAEQYIEEGHFANGSMLPKVKACLKFVKSKHGRKALITSLKKAADGIEGKTGTLIQDY